jgi:sodium/hydrogen antiporter
VEHAAFIVVAAAIFIWGAVSARLERADLTAPIVFTAIGAALYGWGLVHPSSAPEALKPLVEVTLVWVLFSDAAGVPPHEMRHGLGRIVRLLAVGLPLTVLAGWGLAYWLFPHLGIWLVLLIAAALAPTDAALGLPVVANKVVPSSVRRLITVESGLNDGIVTPISCSRSQALRPRRGSLTLRVCGKRWPSWLSVWSWAQASAWGRLVAAPDAP